MNSKVSIQDSDNRPENDGADPDRGAARHEGQHISLAEVHRSWGLPDDDAARWLLHRGLDEAFLLNPYPVGGALVRFLVPRGTFYPAPNGERALTFRATDCGRTIDIIAWQPTSGRLASWRGQAFCLGDIDDITNPASYFDGSALRIHRSPLEWLRAGRQGIVILRQELCWVHLRDVPRVSFADEALADDFVNWVQPPKPVVETFIEIKIPKKENSA